MGLFSKVGNSEGDMTLKQFKFIWTMEYAHRMWGRALGVVFLVPCAYFWYRGHFSRGMKIKMTAAGSLIGAQVSFGFYILQRHLNFSFYYNSFV